MAFDFTTKLYVRAWWDPTGPSFWLDFNNAAFYHMGFPSDQAAIDWFNDIWVPNNPSLIAVIYAMDGTVVVSYDPTL